MRKKKWVNCRNRCLGVMWAADVVCGYVQEAKGKESKRVTEAISDWALDTAKQ